MSGSCTEVWWGDAARATHCRAPAVWRGGAEMTRLPYKNWETLEAWQVAPGKTTYVFFSLMCFFFFLCLCLTGLQEWCCCRSGQMPSIMPGALNGVPQGHAYCSSNNIACKFIVRIFMIIDICIILYNIYIYIFIL